MSHRITAALGAAALLVGLGVVAAPAAAASARDCDTWQYRVTESAGIYDRLDNWKGTASRGWYLNVTERDLERPEVENGRYYGSVYLSNKLYNTFGGILVSKLDYVDCW